MLALLAAATLPMPSAPARAQQDIQAIRRRLMCAQLGLDLTSPLGMVLYRRCIQQGPLATVQRRPVAIPQLVKPVGPLIAPGSALTPPAGDGCRGGFVWREAVPGDHVCVVPGTRARAAADNTHAAERVNRINHDYGADTCQGGYVWREATQADHVCVIPATRAQAWNDNTLAASRKAR